MSVQIEGYKPAGSYTTDDVLQVMADYAKQDSTSEEVQNLIEEITKNIKPDDYKSMMLAIRNWILVNLTYVKDAPEARRLFQVNDNELENGELEMVKSPTAVLKTRKYDCDCCASLIASCLLALGIPCRFVAVGFSPESLTGPDGFSHVYCEGYDGFQWIIIDPVSHPNEKKMKNTDTKQAKIFDIS